MRSVKRTFNLRISKVGKKLASPQVKPNKVKPRPACVQFHSSSAIILGRTTPKEVNVVAVARKYTKPSSISMLH